MNYNVQWILAVLLLVAVLPLYLVILLLNLLLNGRPVFYREQRLGVGKCFFKCVKFRTMKKSGEHSAALDSRYEKGRFDSRITKFGYLLRRFSLDELPQLWNVIRGEMALIGPRPIIAMEDEFYGKYSDLLHSVKPGMTGLWQVSGRCLTTYRRRIAINVYYIRHRSWRLDLWILYRTVWAVIGGRGAF